MLREILIIFLVACHYTRDSSATTAGVKSLGIVTTESEFIKAYLDRSFLEEMTDKKEIVGNTRPFCLASCIMFTDCNVYYLDGDGFCIFGHLAKANALKTYESGSVAQFQEVYVKAVEKGRHLVKANDWKRTTNTPTTTWLSGSDIMRDFDPATFVNTQGTNPYEFIEFDFGNDGKQIAFDLIVIQYKSADGASDFSFADIRVTIGNNGIHDHDGTALSTDPVCATIRGPPRGSGKLANFRCRKPMSGRYVVVQNSGVASLVVKIYEAHFYARQ